MRRRDRVRINIRKQVAILQRQMADAVCAQKEQDECEAAEKAKEAEFIRKILQAANRCGISFSIENGRLAWKSPIPPPDILLNAIANHESKIKALFVSDVRGRIRL